MRGVCVLLWCLILGTSGLAHAESFDFDSLRRLVETRRIQTIEDLIAALPDDLRTHYALVFSSRSLQGASFDAPRVILFGSDARLIVTFNGDASERGNSAIETAEFDPINSRFVFRELTFSGDSGSARATVSAPNPARCIACHGLPARPIWDVPPLWPGAYGEHYHAGLSSAEVSGIREFLRSQPTHPRYRYLVGAAAFADRETYAPSSRATYNGLSAEPPNAQLSALLTRQNVQSMVSELAAQPAFAAHRYVLLAAAGAGCGSLTDFYPQSLRSSIGADLSHFAQSSAAADRLQLRAKGSRLASGSRAYQIAASPVELNELRFVAETSLHVSTQRWTLALERGTYDFSAPADAFTFEQALFELIARSDEGVRDLGPYRTFDAADAYCRYLLRESRQALEAWYGARMSASLPASEDLQAPAGQVTSH